ncbi:MAG: hypothetical protein BJ554DRAFT_6155 [Olpidium bornovanus]|uniref:EF-hand domain-containing protein n=1 Tax=Olpidium bornovanus TaxID=278681 RepID=A0A8H7ZY00_9FUNG|nr:MAG: hypothetical protein BJ554DRAFT_6155 [Olpidium bornovanus]
MADETELPPARIKPLLDEEDEDGDLTAEFERVLREVFERFDVDRDGEWSTDELQAFAAETNGEQFDDDSLKEIAENFECSRGTGNLLPAGFVQLYSVQTRVDEPETRKDLAAWGYSLALERVGRKEAARERERHPEAFAPADRKEELLLEQAREEEDPDDTEEDPLGEAQ